MSSVDVVILWVNPEDQLWRDQYNKYAKEEGRNNFESIRYRDYGTLNYLFRGIENNAPWVNKVHLILSSATQIPKWLNTSNPKLSIHFHREFIPINLLPTFNSNCIELFLHRIKDLSENYILFNDDQFILNRIDEEMFVKDNLPVFDGHTKKLKFRFDITNTFKNTLDNNLKFVINYCTDRGIKARQYKHQHLPEIHIKSFERNIVKNNEILFILSLIDSRWRCDKNFTNWLFSDLIQSEKKCVIDKTIYDESMYTKLTKDLNYDSLRNKKLVCINDDTRDDFTECTSKLKEFLNSIYPNKSSFEK